MSEKEACVAVTSGQFADGGHLPLSAASPTAGGQGISPDLAWSGAPPGTASLAVSMYDPDAPTPVGWVHWLLFNIDPHIQRLDVGAGAAGKNPPGSTLGFVDAGQSAYSGAAPPPGDPPHHYQITVYALDTPHLDLGPTTTLARFYFTARDHILGTGQLTGLFGL